MLHVRFPMMTPRQLAELLLVPLTSRHKDFFVERMAMGMSFHSGVCPLGGGLGVRSLGQLSGKDGMESGELCAKMIDR